MRALRVAGLGIDGRTVILETVPQRPGERREQFTLPADDTLQAAVRGDLPRLDQVEIELENQMRPREIQARIRAGASVEQLAAAAGAPSERIERFAYPVLLERSRIAQLAQRAHPVRTDGPDVRTLEEVVTETFRQRGHDVRLSDVGLPARRGRQVGRCAALASRSVGEPGAVDVSPGRPWRHRHRARRPRHRPDRSATSRAAAHGAAGGRGAAQGPGGAR